MIIATTISRPAELDGVQLQFKRFGKELRVVALSVPDGIPEDQVWIVKDMDKRTVNWTRRIFEMFLKTSEDVLIKTDPDSVFSDDETVLAPLRKSDVAGDFRQAQLGMVFLGGFQYFTRHACEVLLADRKFNGFCIYQDIELAKAIARNKLVAYNMPGVNSHWVLGDAKKYVVIHHGNGTLKRLAGGRVIL
jgi:hypothetical protein